MGIGKQYHKENYSKENGLQTDYLTSLMKELSNGYECGIWPPPKKKILLKKGGPNWTVGGLFDLGESGKVYLIDIQRFREDEDKVWENILNQSKVGNYYADTKKKSDLDNNLLIASVGLLGAAFVTQSLNPTGSIEAPNLADTISVESIPEDTFSSIMNMDIAPINIEVSTSKREYIYSQDELNQFKQLGEDLRQHRKIEDPKTTVIPLEA
jgi:hypothetical protein